MEKTTEISATFAGNIQAKIQMSLYTHISGRHLVSLDYMCKKLLKIENTDDYCSEYKEEHTALSHSSVILSACILESRINEFFCDAKYMRNNLAEISDAQITALNNEWETNITKKRTYGILEKYNSALELVTGKSFEKGKGVYQEAFNLITLRNALIHSISEFTTADKTDDTLSSKLYNILNNKFSIKKGTENTGNPFFPDKCFGAGCAQWSALTSIRFIKEFYRLAGLTSNLEFLNKVIDSNNLSSFQ